MKKCLLFLGCVLVLFCLSSCEQNDGDDNETTTTTTLSTTTTTAQEGLFYNDFEPATGIGESPPGAQGLGPWATRLMLATSADGLTFTRTQEIVCDQAGVPNVIVDHDGYVRIYYIAWQQYGNQNGNDGNFIAFAIQNPEDGRWYFHKVLMDKTFVPGAVDPSVVLLPDGKYRLYFMADTGNFDLKIFSATSADGLRFIVDSGERLDPDSQIFDPMVLKTENSWLLVAGPDGAYSSTSDDGLIFSEPKPFKVSEKRFHAWAGVALPQGGYRLYGYFNDTREKLTSVSSADGINWQADGVTCLTDQGADPSLEVDFGTDVGVDVLPDGTFLMAYLATIPK